MPLQIKVTASEARLYQGLQKTKNTDLGRKMPFMKDHQIRSMMHCQAVIFDLDGTLLDTLGDIANAANQALTAYGYPTHPVEAYKYFVGNGAKILMTRALGISQSSPDIVQVCLNRFITNYNQNWRNATRPYKRIPELLAALLERQIRLAVVTNKPHRFTAKMVAHYFNTIPFNPVLGQQDTIPKKPHPQQALAAAEQMSVPPSACIFIGDSAVDMETGIRAGMLPVGASWGFRSARELWDAGAKAVISEPLELLDLISSSANGEKRRCTQTRSYKKR